MWKLEFGEFITQQYPLHFLLKNAIWRNMMLSQVLSHALCVFRTGEDSVT
jgi:hypothetical protein